MRMHIIVLPALPTVPERVFQQMRYTDGRLIPVFTIVDEGAFSSVALVPDMEVGSTLGEIRAMGYPQAQSRQISLKPRA